MFSKYEKGKSNQDLSQLTFASSLPLENAIDLLTSLADENHPITLIEVSPHKVEFEIGYIPKDVPLATVKGSLQRWNGIETKLDAKGDVIRLDRTSSKYDDRGAIISTIVLAIAGSGVALAFGQIWLVPPIIFGAMGMSYYGSDYSKENKPSRIVLFRERDYLFQRLIDAFKAVSEVEGL